MTLKTMKTTTIIILIGIAILGAPGAYAQGGPGCQGAGYGGPPKTDEERAARQEQCQNGSSPLNGQGRRLGQAQNRGQRQCDGQGNGSRPRDGSGSQRRSRKGNGNGGGNR
jgi:hypothetical protein